MNEFGPKKFNLYKSRYVGYNYDEGPLCLLEPYFDVTPRIAFLIGKGIMLGPLRPKTGLFYLANKNLKVKNKVMPITNKTVKLEIELDEELGKEFLDRYRTNKLDFHYKCVGVGIKRVRLVESRILIIFNFIKKILSWPIRFWVKYDIGIVLMELLPLWIALFMCAAVVALIAWMITLVAG